MKIANAQRTVNLPEAQGNDRYSARWRSTAGWDCVDGLAYAFILGPILTRRRGIIGAAIGAALLAAPLFEVGQLMILPTSMLDLGVQRTVERTQGIAGTMPSGTKS